jgi:hypothetical protein
VVSFGVATTVYLRELATPGMNLLTRLTAALVLSTLGGASYAQPPIKFVNSAEAVKRYEIGMLDALRERCPTLQAQDLWDRPEHSSIRSGFIYVQDKLPVAGQYRAMAYDQDTGKFTIVEGQLLSRGLRLTLKMALPRDYARCRIVTDPRGAEFLEIATFERTYASESLTFKKLLKDAQGMANRQASSGEEPVPGCDALKPTGGVRSRLLLQGAEVELSECLDSTHLLRARMARVLHRVFEN